MKRRRISDRKRLSKGCWITIVAFAITLYVVIAWILIQLELYGGL